MFLIYVSFAVVKPISGPRHGHGTPGEHTIVSHAIDANGQVQPEKADEIKKTNLGKPGADAASREDQLNSLMPPPAPPP